MSVGFDDLGGALPFVNSTLPFVKDEVDPVNCRLLGQFAILVQLGLGGIVFSSLLLKRAKETPRRPIKVWAADVSKQVLGQIFVHFTNIAVSDLGSRFDAPNPCSHYFLNIVLDTTVGVLILWLFLQALTSLCVKRDPDSFQTGEYGTPFNWAIWGKQACVYVCALTLMKIVIVTFLLLVPQLGYVASWMISWAKDDETQVLIVMLVVPVVMNVTQFVIIDSILKSKAWAEYGSMKPDFDAGDEEEGLLGRPSTDDDHPRAPASSSGAALAVDTTLSPPLKKALESPKGPMSARSITTPMTPTSQGMTRARSSSLQRKMARNHYPPVQAIATPVAPLPPRALYEIEPEKRNVHTEEKEQQEEQEEEEWGFEDEDWDDRDEDGEAAWGLDQSAGRLSKDSAEGIGRQDLVMTQPHSRSNQCCRKN